MPELPLPLRLNGDERLARAAAAGDHAAFATLDARYRCVLLGYARSIVRHEHDAEDVVQATLMNALRALREDERRPPLRPWLFRIAHNEAVTVLRRRRPQVGIDEATLSTATLSDDIEHRERLREVLCDLDHLTHLQRSALVMRELGGLSYDAIAVALSTTPEAARQTARTARLSLADQAQGRDALCSDVRLTLAGGDRRRFTRSTRAHLRSCAACRAVSDADGRRRRTLQALLPHPGPWLLLSAGGAGSALGGGNLAVVGTVAGKAAVAAVVVGTGVAAFAPHGPVRSAPARPATTATAVAALPVAARARHTRHVAAEPPPRGPSVSGGANAPGLVTQRAPRLGAPATRRTEPVASISPPAVKPRAVATPAETPASIAPVPPAEPPAATMTPAPEPEPVIEPAPARIASEPSATPAPEPAPAETPERVPVATPTPDGDRPARRAPRDERWAHPDRDEHQWSPGPPTSGNAP